MNKQIDFEPVIGLEVHAQLQTKTKIFCGCAVVYGDPPNSHTCPVCLGLPGALPLLNQKAVEFATRTILAVKGEVRNESVFARKNYFYPDLPKGYQISQFDLPIGEGGKVEYILPDGEKKECRLTRIHLEEDAGKSLHPEDGSEFTRVDLNRCGSPLIEIVSEPDIRSGEEARCYLEELKLTLQYLRVCSGDMEKGHLRCDANVSVRPRGSEVFGTRTELKNMNSFKAVERAINYEIERQTKLILSGGAVEQATLLWNEEKQRSELMRSKEDSHDYRYFPDPDLLPLKLLPEMITSISDSIPELSRERALRLVSQYGIREYDANVLTSERPIADYYEEVIKSGAEPQASANWIITELLGELNSKNESIDDCRVTPSQLSDLLLRVKSDEISGKIAKTVFSEMIKSGSDPGVIINKEGLAQVSDEDVLNSIIDAILSANSDNVEAYRSGKTALLGFFVGQAMKATQGKANPSLLNKLLKRKLDS